MTENMISTTVESAEVYLIRALTKQGRSCYFSIDQLDKPIWVDAPIDAMEFLTYGETETYILENIIKCPGTEQAPDGTLTIIIPGVLNADIRPMTVEIQKVVTTVELIGSESLNTIKESFREVMDVLESAIGPYREMITDELAE